MPPAPADRLVTLPSGTPEFTLGWGVAQWAMTYLRQPNGPRAGQPFRPTPQQLDFLLWWYAVDTSARWVFQHAVRRLSKGSGKARGLQCSRWWSSAARFGLIVGTGTLAGAA